MTTKFLAAALLASATAFGPATTALADDLPAAAAAAGYVYPDFWATSSAAKQQSGAAVVDQMEGPSIGLYTMHVGHGTYLFPPNPYW